MSALKKQRTDDDSRPSKLNIVSTTSNLGMLQLHSWLLANKVVGLGLVDFKYSGPECGGSLGCFARERILEGDTIFIIPQACIIGINNAVNTNLSKFLRSTIAKHKLPFKLTSELLIWLHMIEQRAVKDGDFEVYLNSLDVQSPSLLGWNKQLLSSLEGTNLGVSLYAAAVGLQKHVALLDAVRSVEPVQALIFIPGSLFSFEALVWARGHYLARRYPGEFAFAPPAASPVAAVEPVDSREEGLENLGSLVPLLDILNHNDEEDWLRLEVYNNCLYVKCNHSVEKGAELYSNYGLLSNEKLLYAYGFATPGNIYDSISVTLKAAASRCSPSNARGSSSSASGGSGTGSVGSSPTANGGRTAVNLGVFHIEAGGINGIPSELWKTLSALGQGGGGGSKGHDRGAPDQSGTSTSSGRNQNASSSSSTAADGTGGDVEEEEEQEEEEEVEVGLDECLVLRDYLAAKKTQFGRILHRSNELLQPFGVTLSATHGDSATTTTTTTTTTTDSESSPTPSAPQQGQAQGADIRALYIKYYLEGQHRILAETIEALEELIISSTPEGDDDHDEEEENEEEEE